MLSFVNDYSEGAHEQVLRRLAETNRGAASRIWDRSILRPGKGEDPAGLRLPGGGTSFSWWAGPRPIRR